jgi:hypothetical protein
MKQLPLERLHAHLGYPSWFYPAVMFILFVVLPCVASALESP